MITYLSVCSGIEAATVAWHGLGFVPVGYAEIEPFPSRVLAHHYGSNMPGEPLAKNGVPNHGDFTTLIDDPPDCDILVGGTPCQAFSIAGKRLSLADDRGNLSLAFVRLAHAIADRRRTGRPFRVVWENVPGVLSTADNAFGCFVAGLVGADDALHPPDGQHWPGVGMVAGPRARLAWRVLDAQYFGLAQRRKRVFLVAGFGDRADPATVLFERKGLRGHPAPGETARQSVAGTLGSRAGGGGGLGTDFDLDGGLIAPTVTAAYADKQGLDNQHIDGGGACSLPPLAMCLNAGAMGRQDAESETLITTTGGVFDVAHPLLAKGNDSHAADLDTYVTHSLRGDGFDASEDGTGRGTPLVVGTLKSNSGEGGWSNSVDHAAAGMMLPVYAIQERAVSDNPAAGPQGLGAQADVSYTLEARHHVQAVAYRTSGNDGAYETGDRTDALTTTTDPAAHVLAFALRGREGEAQVELSGDQVGALRAAEGGSSRDYVAFSSKDHGADAGALSPTLRAGGHAASHANAGVPPAIASAAHVRRLTPRECERLQGFPDDYTLIPIRKGMAADGPRYKALGNSMAVPVMRWIGERIAAQIAENGDLHD